MFKIIFFIHLNIIFFLSNSVDLQWQVFLFFNGTWIAPRPLMLLPCRAQLARLGENQITSCFGVQIVRPYRLHCPLEDMTLLQGMNQIFTYIDSVLFRRKQEVLLSLTHGKQHCTAQSADNTLMNRLQNELQTALNFSALDPSLLPAHLQTRRAQLLLEQVPLLDRGARWYDR